MIGNRSPLLHWRGYNCVRLRSCALVFLVAIVGNTAVSAAKRINVDAQLGLNADDNVSRAAQDASIRKDRFLSGSIGIGSKYGVALNHRVLLRAFVQGEAYEDYEGLSNLGGGVAATWQYRRSARLLAPTWALFGRYTAVDYDSWRRDANIVTVGTSVNKALTDRINFLAQFSGTSRDSNSEVFDTRETSLLFNLDYRAFKRLSPYATYNYLKGDIVSSGAQWLLAIDNAKVAPELDDALPGLIAYRLDARTHVGTLGLNINIDEHQSFDFSARAVHSKSDGDITYKRASGTVAYLFRF